MNPLMNPIAFWLVTGRLGGFIALCPGFSSDEMPAPRTFKALLVAWLAFTVMPGVVLSKVAAFTIPDLACAMGCEFLLGLGSALALRMIFFAVRMGGTVIDSELSFLAAEQFNPMMTISGGLFNRLLGLAALWYFWMLDYASLLIIAVHKSFNLVPVGSLQAGLGNYDLLVKLSANAFISGMIIASPIIALMFFLNVGIALVAKMVQGINIFVESFTLRIIVGTAGAILFLPLLLAMVRNEMAKLLPAFNAYYQNAAT